MMDETHVSTPKGVRIDENGDLLYSTTYISTMYNVRVRKFFAMLTLIDCIYYYNKRFKPCQAMLDNGYIKKDELLLYHSLDGAPFKVVRYWWTAKGCEYLEKQLRKTFKLKLKVKFYAKSA